MARAARVWPTQAEARASPRGAEVAHVRAVRHHRVVFDRRRWDLGPDVPAP